MKGTNNNRYTMHLIVAGIITIMVVYIALYLVQVHSFNKLGEYLPASHTTYSLTAAATVILSSYLVLKGNRPGWILAFIMTLYTIYRDASNTYILKLTSGVIESTAWKVCDIVQYLLLACVLLLLLLPIVRKNCLMKPRDRPENRRIAVIAYAVEFAGCIICIVGSYLPFSHVEEYGNSDLWSVLPELFNPFDTMSAILLIIMVSIIAQPILTVVSLHPKYRVTVTIILCIVVGLSICSSYIWQDSILSFSTIKSAKDEIGRAVILAGAIVTMIGSLSVLYSTRCGKKDDLYQDREETDITAGTI